MPVTTNFAHSCPFLAESDFLSLSPHVSIAQGGILDVRLNLSHDVEQKAMPLLDLLKASVSYEHIRKCAKEHHITEIQLVDLLGFLNTIGGLGLQRKRTSKIKSICVHGKYMALGILFSPLIRRLPWSKWNLLVSLLRATTPVIAGAVVATSLMVMGNFANLKLALICLLWGSSIFIGSLWIHEITHLKIIESSGIKSDLLQSNLRIGILHVRLAPRIEIISAVLGPFAGITFSALMLLVSHSLHLPLALSVIAGCVAVFHFGSFLPWYGDGASIKRSIKSFGVRYGNSDNDQSGKI